MKLSSTSHTYKQISILALLIAIVTNYYVIAVALDTISILLASSNMEVSVFAIDYPLNSVLQLLAPVSYISLLTSIVFYIKFRRAASDPKKR